jgi:hypothetical protein
MSWYQATFFSQAQSITDTQFSGCRAGVFAMMQKGKLKPLACISQIKDKRGLKPVFCG